MEKKAELKKVEEPEAKISSGTVECSPLSTWSMGNGQKLVVCAFGESLKASDTEFSGWINIRHQEEYLIPEVDSELPSEFYSFKLQKRSSSEIKITRLIVSKMDGAGTPAKEATERLVKCIDRSCTIGKEVCLNQKIGMDKKEAVRRIKRVISGKEKPNDSGYYDLAIGELVETALAGNIEALKLMKKSAGELKADGAAAEAFDDGKHLINELKKLGCI